MDDKTAKQMRELGGLYEIDGRDWELTVHHCLTEPTCPTAMIRPEGSDSLRYCVHADTIEAAIERVVDIVYREQILGENAGHQSPVTNPDDWTPVRLTR